MTTVQRHQGSTRRIGLAVLAGFTALAALGGALALATGTSGMSADITSRFPFESVILGGLALLLVVAMPMGAVAWLAIRHSPLVASAAIAAGALLIGWILMQIAVIATFFWLQPVCLLIGVAVLGLGVLDRHSARHR